MKKRRTKLGYFSFPLNFVNTISLHFSLVEHCESVHGFPDSLVLMNLICIEVDVLTLHLSFEIRETMNTIQNSKNPDSVIFNLCCRCFPAAAAGVFVLVVSAGAGLDGFAARG